MGSLRHFHTQILKCGYFKPYTLISFFLCLLVPMLKPGLVFLDGNLRKSARGFRVLKHGFIGPYLEDNFPMIYLTFTTFLSQLNIPD